jgi:hypothetical protein
MQQRQCTSRPRSTTDEDPERRLSDYTAGHVDGELDRADASLSTE